MYVCEPASVFCRIYRAVNNALLDTYQLKSLDGVFETPIEKMQIRRQNGKLYVIPASNDYSNDTGDQLSTRGGSFSMEHDNYALREPYDRIIRCLGFKFDESLFNSYVRSAHHLITSLSSFVR